MRYYLAPLEGITTCIYRNAYHKYFYPMDKYFTPFLVPHSKKGFSAREKRDILPEHNGNLYIVPQILSNHAEDCLQTIEKLKQYGYKEVNLNMGCPSKTVVSKYRGSGFLAKPEELDRFLDTVLEHAGIKISVKTRIGRDEPEEFERLLEIYNQYPLEELIIHPRVQKDFYKNHPNMEMFSYAVENSSHPLCYNGDVFTAKDAERISGQFPEVPAMMLGRGIIANPGLAEEIRAGKRLGKARLREFHDEVYYGYRSICPDTKPVLFKMKELWCYMAKLCPGCEKQAKKIKKAERFESYEMAVEELFSLLS